MLAAAFTTFWLTEVDASGQFAYAQDVETVGGDVGAQRAKCFESLIQLSRTQIAE